MSWLSDLWNRLTKPKPIITTTRNPLDRTWADAPIMNQESDGLPNACSAYAVTSAMTQFLSGRVRFDPRDLWIEMREFQNLTAALCAAGRLPGTSVGGIKGSDSKTYSLDKYVQWDSSISDPIDFIKDAFLHGYAVVVELRQSPELNDDAVIIVNPSTYYDSTHAVCVSEVSPSSVIIKNSFGRMHGNLGYQTLPSNTLRESIKNMYSIISVGVT